MLACVCMRFKTGFDLPHKMSIGDDTYLKTTLDSVYLTSNIMYLILIKLKINC